ncbi:tRNA sulfurtransferase [Pseudohongiella nitratireducens]|uniref:tRNA sulfurtransferase n=1 Tax=Pseudohongiella nitratireducens TaxID=1768907 RepID=A0A917LPU2_9GAMM|nr:tRNA uracil 4-sulfurtransferase ThiI [Pseudohongiella nitratireducens]MDF1622868.1 tRNA 4-thiouridine(8) synthase ThiI [Pseudohongiella nitratireducens]GGG49782.1 tRNA sulfurtransferase [Pseudohongiella nitratireducens]
MLYIIRFFPEMTIKSRPVRQKHVKALRGNLRIMLERLEPTISVTGDWDILEVETASDDKNLLEQVEEILLHTPGISLVMPVTKLPLPEFDDIAAPVLAEYRQSLSGRSFAVRCKRRGKQGYTSSDVERQVGAVLMRESDARSVDLRNPEVTVRLEIRDKDLYVIQRQLKGLGGFPLGTQEGVLSLISGGFDSAVSSYQVMRRGLQTHFLFFNLGGREHELAVKEVALYLWMKFGSSHRVKFVSVPFENVVNNILEHVDNGHMGVILKRMMIRAADRIADEMGVRALVTGESIAQVSSQTLPNLAVIDSISNCLIIRPLVVSDKQDIIDTARAIGTETFSANVPEYCGVISVKPTTHARKHRVEEEEAKIDFSILEAALADKEVQRIDRVVEVIEHRDVEPDSYQEIPQGAVVIDVRHPDEMDRSPLSIDGVEVMPLPFYQLASGFSKLPSEKQYLLYCDRGMMSRLHASHLKDAGHNNVAVYRPE